MIELRQLRFFVTLSETGNFARAADREHITQSALSQQIARLERQLGVVLFERLPRGTQLTSAGEALLRRAQLVLAEAELFMSEASAHARGVTGVLRIGSPTYAVRSRSRQQIMGAYARRYPGVETTFVNAWSPVLVDQVVAGELDATFAMLGPANKDLDVLAIQNEPAVLVTRTGDSLTELRTVELSALRGRRVLVYPHAVNAWLYDRIAAPLQSAGVEVIDLAESSLPAVLDQVRSGQGVFPAVPWEMDFINPELLDGLTLRATSGEAGLRYGLWLVRRHSRPSEMVDALWQVATEIYPPDAVSNSL